ncbi:MAG: hypothetical protein HC845_01245 [Akkermansiaceae bacterium]|nr:hypothetical protein [Akkermansiaceae bacterium]
MLPDGKIIAGGYFTTFDSQSRRMLVRLNSNGSVDSSFSPPTFGSGANWRVESLAAQSDGKILVGGTFYFSGSTSKSSICRITSNGTLDSAFSGITNGAHAAGNTSSTRTVSEIEVNHDGTILISGNFTAFNNNARGGIAKLTTTGALDATFAPTSNGEINALRLQPDGKILVGGTFTTLNGATAAKIGRLTSLGVNDIGFLAAGGHTAGVEDFAFQPDGRIVMGADYGTFQNALSDGPLWRFYAGLSSLPGTVQLAAETATGIEGVTLNITATRTGGTAGAITVGYSTVAASAAAGTDFTTTSGVLTWANGDGVAKTISIPVLNDTLADNGETFLVNLGESLIGTALLHTNQQATVTTSTAFIAWQSTHFTISELTDTNISGGLADPDGDGHNNLTEFALGLLPKAPDGAGALSRGMTNISGNNYLTLTFRRRLSAADLAYTVQNNNLLEASWPATAVQVGSAVNNGDGTETVTFRDSVPVSSSPKRFMRLQIQRQP